MSLFAVECSSLAEDIDPLRVWRTGRDHLVARHGDVIIGAAGIFGWWNMGGQQCDLVGELSGDQCAA
ncbi:Uncharacterised protein [Mycobacteroides abscessus subsp. abscessus]|nr:Uncharacterised protein [Mycobacteroides abscessus subsp. abscessus]